MEKTTMYKIPSVRTQITPIKKNGGFIVIGGVLWLSFALAGAGVAAVDYAIDQSPATTAIAQTPPPALAEN